MRDEWVWKKTARRARGEGVEKEIVEVEFGLHQLGEQTPYFSVTGAVYDRHVRRGERSVMDEERLLYWMASCGQIREDIAAVFPEVVPFMRWHLTSTDQPMHYVANAIYWAEKMFGCSPWAPQSYDPDPTETFKSTTIFGALPSDDKAFAELVTGPIVKAKADAENAFQPGVVERTDADIRRDMQKVVRECVTAWCEQRRILLMQAFELDMERAKGLAL